VIAPFKVRYRRALADPRLRNNLLAFQRAWQLTRDAAFARLGDEGPALGAVAPSFNASNARLVAAKDSVLGILQFAGKLAAVERAGAIHPGVRGSGRCRA